MKYLKALWPVVLFIAVICICVNEWSKASTDAGGVIVFFIVAFCVILPVCALVTGLWYGYIFKGEYKWIFLPVGLIPGLIVLLLCGDFSLSQFVFEIPPVVGAFLGQLFGKMIWKAREKSRG